MRWVSFAIASFKVSPRARPGDGGSDPSPKDAAPDRRPLPKPRWRRLLAPGALGLVAGVLVVAAATYPGRWFPASRQGAWFVESPVLSSPDLSKWVAFATYYTGIALLGLAWMWLVRVIHQVGASVLAVLALLAVWAAPFAIGPPVGSDDAVAYVAAGQLVEKGLDPYEVGIVALGPDEPVVPASSPIWRETPQPYGPLYLRVAELASRLGGSSFRAQIMVLRLAGIVCLALLALPLAALARRFGRPPSLVLATVLCSPLVVVHLIGGVHNESFMLLALVTGVAVGLAGLATEGHRRQALLSAGVSLCGVGATVKVPALLGAAVLGWLAAPRSRTGRRFLVAAGYTGLAGAVVALLSLASGLGLGWLHTLDVPQKVFTNLAPFSAMGTLVRNSLDHLGVMVDVVPGFRTAGFLVGLLVVGAFTVNAHRLGLPLALGLALLALALTTPVTWAWYFTWALVFLALWSMPRLLQLGVVALNFTVTPLGPASLDVNGHPTWSALLVVAVTSVVAIVAARRWWERRPMDHAVVGLRGAVGPRLRGRLESR